MIIIDEQFPWLIYLVLPWNIIMSWDTLVDGLNEKNMDMKGQD